MHTIKIQSTERNQIIDITHQINNVIREHNYESGLIVVYSPHTTAAITVNENADPDVKTDMIYAFNHLVPNDPKFKHMEGNSNSHVKGSMIGFSQTFIVEDYTIQLGTWQSIYFIECDGPRHRKVWLQFISA